MSDLPGFFYSRRYKPCGSNKMPLPPPECKVFTPPSLAQAMVSAIYSASDVEWLDPCVGPGAFVQALRAQGVPKDRIVALDIENAPGRFDSCARTARGVDFFRWLPATTARFDKIIANPPYVPIERLPRSLQRPILSLNAFDSSSFRLSSNYWCAFLAGSLRVLKDGGDLAFVLPAAWEYANYAGAIKGRIFREFRSVEVHRCLKPLFDTVSEGCVVLIAKGYGAKESQPTSYEHSDPNELIGSLLADGKKTSRPKQDSSQLIEVNDAVRLGDILKVGIGCVTGDSQYFLLTESQRLHHSLPRGAVTPIVSKARHLKSAVLRASDWYRLLTKGERVWLFKPDKGSRSTRAVRRYLELGEETCDLKRNKLRSREDWWDVPTIETCDGFLSGMTKLGPWISLRSMRDLSASNTLYVVRFSERMTKAEKATWALGLLTSYCRQQATKLGRRYPDGLVKHEPRDLHSLMIPQPPTTNNGQEALETAVYELVAGNISGASRIADKFFELDSNLDVPRRKRETKKS